MRKTLLFIPLTILSLMFALSFSAGWLSQALSVSANEANLMLRFTAPAAPHFLGTDELGRDVLMRLLHGGQISLSVALAAAFISAVIGSTIGMVAGYFGGIWDAVLMRVTDFLIALPALPLLIILSAVDLEKLGISASTAASPYMSLYKIILLISLFGWTTVARLARARTLTLKSMDFVLAAKALGVRHIRIIFRHILPNLLNTVIVATALAVGNIILVESVLSFLGLGIQPPMASWGNMLSNAGENIWDHAGLAIYPGIMIFITVLAFNFLADGLQAALDPKDKQPT